MKMKAAIYHGQEDVTLEEVDVPRIKSDEVLVKVEAALTCGTDRKMYLRGHPLFKPPFIFGHEFAGTVVKVGDNVKNFKEGTRVVAANSAPCNSCYFCKIGNQSMCDDIFLHLSGAFAEFAVVPAQIVKQNLLEIPSKISFQDAALVEPLACVVHGIERSGIHLGNTVVVNGAGPIGLMFVRLAALKGAMVICTDMKKERLDVAKSLGAHEIVDVSAIDNAVSAVRDLTEDRRGVDIAIEAVGLPSVWQDTIAMVRKGGTANLFGGCASGTTITVDTGLIHYSEVTIKGVFHHTPRYVKSALDLIAIGAIDSKYFISCSLPLSDLSEILDLLINQQGIKTAVIP
ncbi:MAG: alcohol dehydrogenase catalytic domain-containing protein [Actinobacteria bacterium]|nr:alcohol dehydrogenase catalytic domain-containing protein [Actinomycetota bacterium]